MVQSLKLGGAPEGEGKGIRRLNRLPIIVAIVLVIVFFAVIFYGLTSRGLYFRRAAGIDTASSNPASTYADQLKKGVSNGIIGDQQEAQTFQPAPAQPEPPKPASNPFTGRQQAEPAGSQLESEALWRARLEREAHEQYLREQQRQRMARVQANDAAYDSPLGINLSKLQTSSASVSNAAQAKTTTTPGLGRGASDLYATALRAGFGMQNIDPNGQMAKEDFFNADLKKLGYLPNKVVAPTSAYELKRGSVIPATLITGINSDLPGRITAQVSQNVYDSATGHQLLIPQGAKLLGRYDSKVAFGQSRVLVVWTDIVFPNGSTLQIGGMAGTDPEGYGGFNDQVDNHYFQVFGSAILIAAIGAGIDMSVPASSPYGYRQTPSDSARNSFAETFGRVIEQTISKNMNVQPTLEIRPGYLFNVLVDQDMVFPGAYRG
ncbi:type IV secretory pathway VirB10-like protein [Bradyrhizobium diazoefficiens]|jgi:type IV secretion system protein VirB10|uniref:IncP-type conjugal transfer protein TrbI n=1 Tax=Bradyrhizobium TaxID=374 RepID=UPI0003FD1DC2|nr:MULTISPECIES: IncP-type conjugal transfer protein TrbI [Bradyrhizobium]BAP81998.1 conjugal transfer protein TrbI [Bradyrhizobium diazoefficiens]MBR0883211.1 IncP-type conjugal transfer protein TrbI [Bradyrhizobium liaoningense]MBR1003389.1 IncP-type conjugal transfer protein TrbI [Bradyrhizobium liaoningense]MBR1069554.1 IncP-type conjugal transfer protein TrbI [Bradyrhizobium liaoningense]MCP1748883.1 type IV secretion system protein VirB10 [Bradyrhizobium japonicum]